MTFLFNLEVFVETADEFSKSRWLVVDGASEGFSKAVSIGLCLLDTWIDSRVIGNIHHSLLGAPECRESAFVVGAVMGQV